jgi:hypothetical protein
MKYLLILSILLSGFCFANAQISLSPSSVFIDPDLKSAFMTISNNTDQPKEVSVNLKFGYIDYNEDGNPYIKFGDSLSESIYSLIPYIKVIPSKLILNPGEETKISYLLKMPPDLPDGTYFTRVIIQAGNAKKIIGDSSMKYESNIEVNTRMIGAVIYMKGEISSGVELTDVNHYFKDNYLNLNVNVKRTGGNSPYFGRINIHILNENDVDIDSVADSYIVVYFNGKQKFSFDATKFRPGKYKAVITADTERNDIPERFIIPTDRIHKIYNFEITE